MALLRTREAVMQHFRPVLSEHALTEQQWRVLRALSSLASIEATQLARLACLLPPSVSRISRDLLERGLIHRSSDPRDQRRSLLSISRKGRAIIATAAPQFETAYATIERRFGSARLLTLQRLLAELESALSGPESTDQG